jgi:hypothetical protein
MSSRNNSQNKISNKNELNSNSLQKNIYSFRESTTNNNNIIRSRKTEYPISKVLLKGKLFNLINKSNIMTDEQYNHIKIKLSKSKVKKYKKPKKNLNMQFYYAQNNPQILFSSKNSDKFEDDYINMRDLLKKKFTQEELKEILSYPQFFQLNSNEYLKELVDERHKTLYEILGTEENKEKKLNELIKIKIDKKNKTNSLLNNNTINNYSSTSYRKNIKVIPKINSYRSTGNIKKIIMKSKIKNNSRNLFFKNSNTYNTFSPKNNIYKNIKTDIEKENYINNDENENNIDEFTSNNINSITLCKEDFENKRSFFHDKIMEKYNIENKKMELKNKEKFENMIKRKEMVILNKRKKLDLIKEKNRNEQSKKEQERLKIYQERKYIDFIVKKLKKNYVELYGNNTGITNNKKILMPKNVK